MPTEADGHRGPPPRPGPRAAPLIVDLGMVRGRHGRARRRASRSSSPSPSPGCPLRNEITNRVTRRRARPSTASRRRPRLHRHDRRGARGAAPAASTATRPPPPAQPRPRPRRGPGHPVRRPGSQHPPLLIASGKGGVGKSLGHHQPRRRAGPAGPLGRRRRRRRLGLLDPAHARHPTATGGHRPDAPAARECDGVRCISMGFFAEEDQPVIWRGPMLHKALEQFLTDVFWDDPDFLLVDLPPGTGDIALSLAQFLPRGRGLRGHHAAARRAEGGAAGRLHGREGRTSRSRASSRTCRGSPATTASATRSSAPAAAQELADELEVPLLGQIPLCRSCARAATPAARSPPSTPTARRPAFAAIAERSTSSWRPTRRYNPGLKLIDSGLAASVGAGRAARAPTLTSGPGRSRPDPPTRRHRVDVRIGVIQTATGARRRAADDPTRRARRRQIDAAAGRTRRACSGSSTEQGREVGVPRRKVAYVEIGQPRRRPPHRLRQLTPGCHR